MLVTWASFSRAFSMAMVTRLAIATRRRTSWGVNTERRRRQTSSTPMISPRTVSGAPSAERTDSSWASGMKSPLITSAWT